jgi:hypothetical protein
MRVCIWCGWIEAALFEGCSGWPGHDLERVFINNMAWIFCGDFRDGEAVFFQDMDDRPDSGDAFFRLRLEPGDCSFIPAL